MLFILAWPKTNQKPKNLERKFLGFLLQYGERVFF